MIEITAGNLFSPIDGQCDDFDIEGSESVVLTLEPITAGDADVAMGSLKEAKVNIAEFNFGDTPDEIAGTYDIILGAFDESDGLASFNVELIDFETGETSQIGTWDLDNNLTGFGGAKATIFITPTVFIGISLTQGDILSVNSVEEGREYARLDYAQLVPTI